jgi:hypothetical protein
MNQIPVSPLFIPGRNSPWYYPGEPAGFFSIPVLNTSIRKNSPERALFSTIGKKMLWRKPGSYSVKPSPAPHCLSVGDKVVSGCNGFELPGIV